MFAQKPSWEREQGRTKALAYSEEIRLGGQVGDQLPQLSSVKRLFRALEEMQEQVCARGWGWLQLKQTHSLQRE